MAITPTDVFIFGEKVAWETAGPGVRRRIMGYDEQLMLVAVEFQKGAIGPLHKHPHRQVTYIGSGSFEVQIDGKKKVQRAGDCYFIPPNVEHGVVALEPSSLVDVFTPAREDMLEKRKQ
jgi:quercetin dioxygenase-like cupin family protein